MYFPFVEPRTKKTRRQVVQFGGLNRTQDVREGELVDSQGLSSREWPCLAQRQGRAYSGPDINNSVTDMLAGDALAVATNGTLFYGGEAVVTLKLNQWPKKMATVNTKLCIFPDKKYMDVTTKEVGDLGAKAINRLSTPVTFEADTLRFVIDEPITVSGEKHAIVWPKSGQGMDVSGFTVFIKVYDAVRWDKKTKSWEKKGEQEVNLYYQSRENKSLVGKYVILCDGEDGTAKENVRKADVKWDHSVETTEDYGPESQGRYGRITDVAVEGNDDQYASTCTGKVVTLEIEGHNGAEENDSLEVFEAGDTVTISGCETLTENNVDIRISAVEPGKLTFDSPVLTPGDESGQVTVERKVPDLDFICEHENRLIGLSNKDKTIYISALGDPRNFYDYRGLSVSSAYIPVGSSGDFTGCISFGGNVLIFKEDCIIRLMGDYDGNYATYTDQVAGLQAGCEKSLVIINEVLYYKGRDGVYAYSGSTPRLISAALGNTAYAYARAGTDGRRYYISLGREAEGTWRYELLVYDTQTGLWMKEEDRRVYDMARQGGTLYMAYFDHDHGLGGLFAVGAGEEDRGKGETTWPIRWEATFAPFDETAHERKYPSRLLLRLELGEGGWVEAELSRDGGPFEHIWTGSGRGQGPTAVIPIRPGRCDRYQLRLRGEGKCLIRSMAREFSTGGVR